MVSHLKLKSLNAFRIWIRTWSQWYKYVFFLRQSQSFTYVGTQSTEIITLWNQKGKPPTDIWYLDFGINFSYSSSSRYCKFYSRPPPLGRYVQPDVLLREVVYLKKKCLNSEPYIFSVIWAEVSVTPRGRGNFPTWDHRGFGPACQFGSGLIWTSNSISL